MGFPSMTTKVPSEISGKQEKQRFQSESQILGEIPHRSKPSSDSDGPAGKPMCWFGGNEIQIPPRVPRRVN